MKQPQQIEDGKWYALNPSTKAEEGDPWVEYCCGCLLCHIVNYKIENGRIWVQYIVDEKRTRAARAQLKREHAKGKGPNARGLPRSSRS